MPRFAYEAMDAEGRHIRGVVEAPTAEAVIEDLRNIRYTVSTVREQADFFGVFRYLRARMYRVSLWSMVIFTRQFATLFNAGVPLIRSFEGLVKQTANRRLTLALKEVLQDIRQGSTVYRAMGKHPDVFSPVYVSLVRAGELGGVLGEILDRTATYLEKDMQMRKRVQAATVYPIIVFLVSVFVTAIMVVYVFPTFSSLLDGLNVALPWPTRLLIFITDVVRSWAFVVFVIVGLPIIAVILGRYFKTRIGKRQLDRVMLDIPIFGEIQRKVLIARFSRTLSTLLASGVPMMGALDVVARVSGNEVFNSVLDQIKAAVKNGLRLSVPLSDYELFPPMVPSMVAVGEETGNLPEILAKVAYFYDLEIEAILNQLSQLIEPFMITFMGCIVGFILLAVFLPVYSILQTIS